MDGLKQKVLEYYKQQIQDKIDVFKDMIAALTVGAENDAKGSAGDKHETTLSMMHLEQEKLNNKLLEFLSHKNILDKIDISLKPTGKVVLGSLVKVNAMYLFISAALPKITINNTTIIALSLQSPLGNKLLGMAQGESFEINSTKYTIENIL